MPEHASLRRLIGEMLVASQVQQAVHVAARLGVADVLGDGPRPVREIADATGAHAPSLHRLLRALAGVGFTEEDEDGRFGLTALGRLLREDEPGSMRPFALWSGGVGYQAFGGLEESVRTGEPAFERIFGSEFFDYLGRHRESGAIFDAMMSRHTAPVARDVATACDFRRVTTLVDVGGGTGELLARILQGHPGLRGVLVDQERVLEGAADALARAGVAERCRIEAADIAHAVPSGGDVYLLKSVLHGLDDDAAGRILRNCEAAMNRDARVVLVEFVVPRGNDPHPSKLMDLLMLIGCHGRERTEDEFRRLLAGAGLELAAVTPAKNGYSVLQAARPTGRRPAASAIESAGDRLDRLAEVQQVAGR
jgi:O-methyltransferase domain/IclR helix-turn-helix domain